MKKRKYNNEKRDTHNMSLFYFYFFLVENPSFESRGFCARINGRTGARDICADIFIYIILIVL